MDINEIWENVINNTEIIRPRIKPLEIYDSTNMPYIFLGESIVQANTTIVRKGKIIVDKPALILPPNMPQLKGFDFDTQKEIVDFLFLRGIRFPSMQYQNKINNLDIYADKLSKAEAFYKSQLQREEDVQTGLIIGPESCWQFSVLMFVFVMASRFAENDIKRLLNDFKQKKNL